MRYGKLPDEIATRPWSKLTLWCAVAGIGADVDEE